MHQTRRNQPTHSPASADWKRSLDRRLSAWYKRAARDLPWRRTRNPYHVWVSEIMLQQTQVATVVGYFERFIAAFPNVQSLAAAAEEDVLKLWEGLGYYRRARQLHRAAQMVVAQHDGQFPRDIDAVRGLPGIGRYTAGAIVSIAFDVRAPILEANTVRLYSRLVAERDPYSTAGQQRLWSAAESWLPRTNAGRFNQALMELGATVCVPRAPRCHECPLATLCQARLHGLEQILPPPKARPQFENVREAAVAVTRADGRALLVRRQEGGRWAGLWDFLRFPLSDQRGQTLEQEIAKKVTAASGLRTTSLERITIIKHGVTRFRITLECFRTFLADENLTEATVEHRWLGFDELADVPLNTTGRKLARRLAEALP